MKLRRDSLSAWKMASRTASVFGCLREAVKCLQNWSVRSIHEITERGARL
ncbi:hypothetical protein L195_g062863, partial [Trifolium pratense]